MKIVMKLSLGVGIISMLIALVLRLMVRQIILGLEPSSFLQFSMTCFLLTIAIYVVVKDK